MSVVPLTPAMAAAAARLHILGQPGAFLTSLGPEVLTVLYRTLPQSPVGFGFGVTGEAIEQGMEGNVPLEGFVAATSSVGALFTEMATRRFLAFAPALLARMARRPALLGRLAQTLFYPLLVQEPRSQTNGPPPAELLSIMVEPALRSHGLGARLLEALLAECRRRDIQALDVTVESRNAGARRFYERHGFGYVREFALYGRAMSLYQRQEK
jgi:ribosomal protein S18 acetylase RimI-like enzyme